MADYERSLGHWVKRFYLLSAKEMESTLGPYGLGRTQWYILHHVNEARELPQRELQTLLSVESATLTPLVAALVEKGWLKQVPSKLDRRNKTLTLSAAGRTHFLSVPNPILLTRKKALSGLDVDDIEHARKVLEAAVRNLERGDAP
jgi:DNA-binding MarR family transcriptional regulator